MFIHDTAQKARHRGIQCNRRRTRAIPPRIQNDRRVAANLDHARVPVRLRNLDLPSTTRHARHIETPQPTSTCKRSKISSVTVACFLRHTALLRERARRVRPQDALVPRTHHFVPGLELSSSCTPRPQSEHALLAHNTLCSKHVPPLCVHKDRRRQNRAHDPSASAPSPAKAFGGRLCCASSAAALRLSLSQAVSDSSANGSATL